jgi:hypothetical protein
LAFVVIKVSYNSRSIYLDNQCRRQSGDTGIEAAKSLVRKKVKLVRVTVKAGYPILLLDPETWKLK